MKPVRRNGRTYLVQNKRYQEFSNLFDLELMNCQEKIPAKPINVPCNVMVAIGRSDKRRTDLVNNLNSILDKLVENGILEDDNYNIVKTLDGSKMEYNQEDYIHIVISKI